MESRIIFCIVLILCLTSCNTRKSAENEIGCEIDDDYDSRVSFDSLGVIDSVRIVQLETENEYVVGNIDKILCNDTLLYLVCKEQEGIFVYNIKGKFLNYMSRWGHGKNEYVHIDDAFLDKRTGQVNVLSSNEKKVLVFDKLCKKVQLELKTTVCVDEMVKVSDGYVGYAGNNMQDDDNPYNFWTFDDKMNIVNKCGKIDERLFFSSYASFHSLSVYKERCNCISELCYDVLSIGVDNSYLRYHFDFGEKNIPDLPKETIQNMDKMYELRIREKYITNFLYFQETDNYCYIYTIFNGNLMFVYDKTKRTMTPTRFIDYVDDIVLCYGDIKGFDEKCMYTTISADMLRAYFAGKDFPAKLQPKVLNLRRKVGKPLPGDNPVVLIWSLK